MKFAVILSLLMLFGLSIGNSSRAGSVEVAPPGAVRTADTRDYALGTGDKIRLLVFNEPQLSGEYIVNANGVVALPLIGEVPAAGLTTQALQTAIEAKLTPDYLLHPSVSIDVLTFRPFYVLGEVNKPGDYAYANGLTAIKAVAIAEGFTYRADKRHIYIKAEGETKETRYDLTSNIMVRPGDTLRIGERYF